MFTALAGLLLIAAGLLALLAVIKVEPRITLNSVAILCLVAYLAIGRFG